MPVEEGYSTRIMPQAGAAMPLATPETYGAALFKGVGDVGDTIHETQLRAYQVERRLTADRESSDAAAKLAQRQATVQAQVNQLELEYGPDHLAKVKEVLSQGQDDLLAGVTEQSVANRIRAQLTEQNAQVLGRAEIFSQVKEAQRSRDNAVTTLGTLDNTVRNAPDREAALRSAVGQWGSYVGSLHNIDEPTREKLGREGEAQLHTSWLLTESETNPEKVDGLVKSGAFNDLLSPQQMAQVDRGIALGRQAKEVATREAEIAARRQAEVQRKAAKDRLDAIGVMIENGDPPSLTDINQAIGQAKAAGVDQADLLRAGYLGETATRARAFQSLSNADLEARAVPLRQREAAGQLDAAGGRELDQIERTLDKRTKHDSDQLSALWRGGLAGQLQALDTLRQMPVSQREQVATRMGNNAAVLAGMEGQSAEIALHGAGIRKARPGDFMPVDSATEKPDEKMAHARFDAIIGPALKNQLGDAYDEVRDTALDYFVGRQAASGTNGGWNEAKFAAAVQTVFGGSVRRDGTIQGGIGTVRGRKIELPRRWTAAEFDRAYSRNDFARAGVTYADGRPVANADVLANYQPVVDHETDKGTVIYRLEDASGRSLRKGKGVFLLPVPISPQAPL